MEESLAQKDIFLSSHENFEELKSKEDQIKMLILDLDTLGFESTHDLKNNLELLNLNLSAIICLGSGELPHLSSKEIPSGYLYVLEEKGMVEKIAFLYSFAMGEGISFPDKRKIRLLFDLELSRISALDYFIKSPIELSTTEKVVLESEVLKQLNLGGQPGELIEIPKEGVSKNYYYFHKFRNQMADRIHLSDFQFGLDKFNTDNSIYNIYLLDDDKFIHKIIEKILGPVKFIKLECFFTVEEFLKRVNENKPELALIDLNLTEKKGAGYLVIQAINRMIGQEINLVVVSKRKNIKDISYALDLGATDCVIKPIHPELFINKIKETINLDLIKEKDIPEDVEFYQSAVHFDFYINKFLGESFVLESIHKIEEGANISLSGGLVYEIFKKPSIRGKIQISTKAVFPENKYTYLLKTDLGEKDQENLKEWKKGLFL